jgi:hypothetical protein
MKCSLLKPENISVSLSWPVCWKAYPSVDYIEFFCPGLRTDIKHNKITLSINTVNTQAHHDVRPWSSSDPHSLPKTHLNAILPSRFPSSKRTFHNRFSLRSLHFFPPVVVTCPTPTSHPHITIPATLNDLCKSRLSSSCIIPIIHSLRPS